MPQRENSIRLDELTTPHLADACLKRAGLAGIVIWGLHRDNQEVSEIGLPLFSLGVLSTGPQRLDTRPSDVFGVVFLPQARLGEIVAVAATIRDTERRQAIAMAGGRSLRDQSRFGEYMARRHREPDYAFRQHLRDIGAAVEE